MIDPRKTGPWIFPDPDCTKVFKSKMDICTHKKSIHDKIRYLCETCGKDFTRKDKVNRQS